jgi:hypothetical protein
MRVIIKFEVALEIDLPKKVYNQIMDDMEHYMGTSLDIETGDVSWLDPKIDDYVYLSKDSGKVECQYTKVISVETKTC